MKPSGVKHEGTVSIYTVTDAEQVVHFNHALCSAEIREAIFLYGKGRILADRTSSLKGAAKADAMQTLADHFESGTKDWFLRVSPEERARRNLAELTELVNLACVRIYGEKAGADTVAKHARKKGMSLKDAAEFFSKIGNIAKEIAAIKLERAAKVTPVMESADDLFAEMDEAE